MNKRLTRTMRVECDTCGHTSYAEQAVKGCSRHGCNGTMTIIPSYLDEIPTRTMLSLKRYHRAHIPTGDFLTAVLSNDLFEAVARADAENLEVLPSIVKFIYNRLPANYWGDTNTVNKWLDYTKEDE